MSEAELPSTSKRDREEPPGAADDAPAAKEPKMDLLAFEIPKLWRKYGEKTPSIGAGRLRKTYFKCTLDECPARKTVLRWPEQTVEDGQHEWLVDHDQTVHLALGQRLPPTLPKAGQIAGSAEDPGTGLNHDYTSGNKNFDDVQDVSRLCGTIWRGMSDDDKKPWIELAGKMRKKIHEEFEEFEKVEVEKKRGVINNPIRQPASGYATRASGALPNLGPTEWAVGCVTIVGQGAEVPRTEVEMNNYGAPVDCVARGLLAELGLMGNPFKVWLNHNVNAHDEANDEKEDIELTRNEPNDGASQYDPTRHHWDRARALQTLHAQQKKQRAYQANLTAHHGMAVGNEDHASEGFTSGRRAESAPIQCRYCPKMFTHTPALVQHERSHVEGGPNSRAAQHQRNLVGFVD